MPNGRTHWEEIYALGTALKLSPCAMDELSWYQLVCMSNAFRRIHRKADARPPAMEDEQLADLGIEGFA